MQQRPGIFGRMIRKGLQMAFGDEWDLRSYAGSPSTWFPDLFHGGIPHETASGITVTENTALNYSAVWLATTLYSSIISTLPREMSRILDEDSTEPAEGHPLRKVFRKRVNPRLSATNFFTLTIPWLINSGNVVCIRKYNGQGRVSGLYPVHPSRVLWQKVEEGPDGMLRYPIRIKTLDKTDYVKEFHQDDVLHIGGNYTCDGITFDGVIPHGNESIGLGMVTEKYGARFFANDAHAGTTISVNEILTDKAYSRLKTSWMDNTGHDKAHSPVIIEQGGKVDRLGLAPEQAQFLQTRKHNITEIARWYNLPVHMLKEMQDSGVRANIEQEGINFVVYSLLPWLVRIEDAFNEQLLHEKDQDYFEFKFEVKGLLRGDQAARAAFYKEMFQMGALDADTVLRLEDMEPIGGAAGSMRFVPANLMTHEQHQAATKQAKKLADAPAPDPNAGPPADPADTQPDPGKAQERDNNTEKQNPANLEAKLEETRKLLMERLDSSPIFSGENGYLKEDTFLSALKSLRSPQDSDPITSNLSPDSDPSSNNSDLASKCLILELNMLTPYACVEQAGRLPDAATELYENILPVFCRDNEDLHTLFRKRYQDLQSLYDLPCSNLPEALTAHLATPLETVAT